LIAAGTLVREGTEIPPGVLFAGVPGKIIRDLRPDEIERMFKMHKIMLIMCKFIENK
jgi:Carbonic anhydrases/acetyltransferases, isoleucine patch superfamily